MSFQLTGDREIDVAVPSYPRVLSEVNWVQLDADKVAVFGGIYGSVFPARYGGVALQSVLAELDGQRHISSYGACQARIYYLRNMFRAGLLECASAGIGGNSPTASFLAVARDQTRISKHRVDAQSWMDQPVRIVGDADWLFPALRRHGVQCESQVGPIDSHEVAFVLLDPRMLNLDFSPWLSAGGKLIPIFLDHVQGTIGPLMVRNGLTVRDVWASLGEVQDSPTPEPLMLEAILHQLLLLHSRSAAPSYIQTLLRFSLVEGTLTAERVPVIRAEQGLAPSAAKDWSERATMAAVPPKHLTGSKPHEVHYNPQNIAAAREHLLPSVDAADLAAWLGATAAQQLSEMLEISFGVRAEHERSVRNCPTGGNLGSPEALVLLTDPLGCEIVLRYIPNSHDFERVSGAQNLALGCSCEVYCLGNHERTTRKYGFFGNKLIWLDSGVALNYLVEAAEAMGAEVCLSEAKQATAIERLMVHRDHYYRSMWSVHVRFGDTAANELALLWQRVRPRYAHRVFSGAGPRSVDVQALLDACQPELSYSQDRTPPIRVLIMHKDASGVVHRSWRELAISESWQELPPVAASALVSEGRYLSQATLDDASHRIFFLCPAPGMGEHAQLDRYQATLRWIGQWAARLWLRLEERAWAGCPCGAVAELDLLASLPPMRQTHVGFAFVLGYPVPYGHA